MHRSDFESGSDEGKHHHHQQEKPTRPLGVTTHLAAAVLL